MSRYSPNLEKYKVLWLELRELERQGEDYSRKADDLRDEMDGVFYKFCRRDADDFDDWEAQFVR